MAIINNAAVSIGVQISLGDSDLFSSDVYTDVGLLDHMVVLFLVFPIYTHMSGSALCSPSCVF